MSRESPAGVIFVTFARGRRGGDAARRATFGRELVTFGRDGAVPCAGEILVPRPLAKPIGALPAHPRRRGGASHAAGRVQRADELDLPVDGPAVTADATGG
jgi:hypothetical protein